MGEYHKRFPHDVSIAPFIPVQLVVSDDGTIIISDKQRVIIDVSEEGATIYLNEESDWPSTTCDNLFVALVLCAAYVRQAAAEQLSEDDDVPSVLLGIQPDGQLRIYTLTYDRIATIVADARGGLTCLGSVTEQTRFFSLPDHFSALLISYLYVLNDERLSMYLLPPEDERDRNN